MKKSSEIVYFGRGINVPTKLKREDLLAKGLTDLIESYCITVGPNIREEGWYWHSSMGWVAEKYPSEFETWGQIPIEAVINCILQIKIDPKKHQ